MKKVGLIFLTLIICATVFFLGFSYESSTQPYTFYQVYLNGEVLGMIDSKKELEDYINNQGNIIKENVLEYQKKIDIIDITEEALNSISNDNYNNLSKLDKINYLINNQKT